MENSTSLSTPDWVKHAIFYQIFPDRFAKGQALDDDFPHLQFEPWESPPTLYGYKGGNLWGVIERLDYLQDLGINAIYFTPLFQSTSYHRYHTHDYYQIDPMLGGRPAFDALLRETRRRNIRVILDGVFNHAGRGFFYFNDVLENGPKSPFVDWFKIRGWPLFAYDETHSPNYACWWNNRALPQFNHDNPDVREYLMRIAEHWLKMGIDGWRLDVPDCVETPGFWQEFRERVKAINPDAYIVGEILYDSSRWLDGTQFDGVMNYLFRMATVRFASREHLDVAHWQKFDPPPTSILTAEEYADKVTRLLNLYPWEIQLSQMNLVSSHDTARILTLAGGDPASVELATLLIFTFPGAPSIYYGDEVGLAGAADPDCRRGFPPEHMWKQDVLAYHRKLIAIRREHRALRTGDYRVLYACRDLYVFTRSLPGEMLLVSLNVGNENESVELELPARSTTDPASETSVTPKVLYGPGTAVWSNSDSPATLKLRMPARSGLIVELTSNNATA